MILETPKFFKFEWKLMPNFENIIILKLSMNK